MDPFGRAAKENRGRGDVPTGYSLSLVPTERPHVPEPGKSKDQIKISAPIRHDSQTKAPAALSLGNAGRKGDGRDADAEAKLNVLLTRWVNEGIAMAIEETSGPVSNELKW